MAITLTQLRSQARDLADMQNNEFVSDSELNNYINFAIAELHDLLVESYGDEYFLSYETGSTSANTADYDLPTDFYKLKGVDMRLNGQDWINIRKFNFNERNRHEDLGTFSLLGLASVRYRVMGSKIKFSPIPDATIDYKIWYVPLATKLVDDSDEFDDINQYSDFVILSAAMKMLNKEESDISALAAERQRIITRLQHSATNRDAAESETISDVSAENVDLFWTRG